MPFDLDPLDPEDPFEVDGGNRPHLFKHLVRGADGRVVRVGLEELRDLYVWEAVRYYAPYQVEGDAEWLMVGEVEGVVIVVPLAPPNSGDVSKCRPIGIFEAPKALRDRYVKEADE